MLLLAAASAAAQETVVVDIDADRVTGDRLRRTLEPADPFAPPERRLGSLIVSSAITATLRGTTNATDSSDGGQAVSVIVAPEFGLRTDWSRHGASLNLRGAYQTFADDAAADEVSAGIDGAIRLDLADQWQVDLAAGYDFGQQEASDPDTPGGLDDRPAIHTFMAGAALSGGAGRLRTTLAADIERTVYEDGTSGGLPVDQGDRDGLVAGARLRLGYETGTLTPFVEAEVDRRSYDRPTDTNALARASTGAALRAGIVIDRGPVLVGEIAVGTAAVAFDDPAFEPISTLTVDGSLVWSPVRFHTYTANVATSISPSTDVATSGSVDVSGDIGWAYAWTPRLTVGWRAGYGVERFEGIGTVEKRASLDVEGRWRLSPHAELTAIYTRAWLASPQPGRSYASDSVQVGLRYEH